MALLHEVYYDGRVETDKATLAAFRRIEKITERLVERARRPPRGSGLWCHTTFPLLDEDLKILRQAIETLIDPKLDLMALVRRGRGMVGIGPMHFVYSNLNKAIRLATERKST